MAKHRRFNSGRKNFPIIPPKIRALYYPPKEGSKCCICKLKFNETRKPQLDHCHITGKVRGYLCLCCNTGMGKFYDNPELMLRAVDYITSFED